MQRSSSVQSQEAEISVQLSKLKEDLEYVRMQNFVIRICKFLFPEDWAETGTQDAEFSKEGAERNWSWRRSETEGLFLGSKSIEALELQT
ncbi:hypothetical protein U1Q18_049931, partial [Sarracenia purpurea var. burkii]